jgi:hypothetical protein
MSALMNGNFNRSNCLIFRNAANNFMFSRYFLSEGFGIVGSADRAGKRNWVPI